MSRQDGLVLAAPLPDVADTLTDVWDKKGNQRGDCADTLSVPRMPSVG
jgi:hypothetical protein